MYLEYASIVDNRHRYLWLLRYWRLCRIDWFEKMAIWEKVGYGEWLSRLLIAPNCNGLLFFFALLHLCRIDWHTSSSHLWHSRRNNWFDYWLRQTVMRHVFFLFASLTSDRIDWFVSSLVRHPIGILLKLSTLTLLLRDWHLIFLVLGQLQHSASTIMHVQPSGPELICGLRVVKP